MKKNSNLKQFVFLLVVSALSTQLVFAQKSDKKVKDKSESSFRKNFVDTTDNALDVSTWMTQLHGFLPIPTVITEPALGYGFNLALIFFHPTKQSIDKKGTGKKQLSLPSMTVAGGLYTANQTWGVYGGHYGSYLDDKLRVKIFTAWLDINMYYYLKGPLGNEHKLQFNLSGLPIYLAAEHKLGKSKWYAGLDYFFYKNETTLKTNTEIPAFDTLSIEMQLAGLGLNVYHQNFDNSFTPNKGTKIKVTYRHNDTWLGSDYSYNTFNVLFLGFANWVDPWIAGLRIQTEGIFGEDYPFVSRPYINLRGIPLMRYQADYIATLETEQRVNLTARWAIDGFVGFGIPFDNKEEFTMANAKWAGGGGFRYLLARWFNLYMGIDVAKGPMPEDWAWYIIFGSYWLGR